MNMTKKQEETTNNILNAAIELMNEKGFHRVSVQEIAQQAGLCEKTIFRYYPSKKELMEAIMERKHFFPHFKEKFTTKRTGELHHDLTLAAKIFMEAAIKNRKVYRAFLSALDTVDTSSEEFLKDSLGMKTELAQYFTEMQLLGKIRKGDVSIMAGAFAHTLYGFSLTHALAKNTKRLKEKSDYLTLSVECFICGIKK